MIEIYLYLKIEPFIIISNNNNLFNPIFHLLSCPLVYPRQFRPLWFIIHIHP